jgi:hypothetical protein
MFAGLLQAIPVPDASVLSGIKDLGAIGTVGFLAIAVLYLWKGSREDRAFFWTKLDAKDQAIKEKDAVIMENYKAMTMAVASSNVVNQQMAETLATIKQTVEHLDTVRAAMGKPQ